MGEDLGLQKPAAFTTYNKTEAGQEEAVLDRLGWQFLLRPSENKWKSLIWGIDMLMERYDTYCVNNFWYIVRGRK